jgi:hypothetical protein
MIGEPSEKLFSKQFDVHALFICAAPGAVPRTGCGEDVTAVS